MPIWVLHHQAREEHPIRLQADNMWSACGHMTIVSMGLITEQPNCTICFRWWSWAGQNLQAPTT